jgi:hypothetical protein
LFSDNPYFVNPACIHIDPRACPVYIPPSRDLPRSGTTEEGEGEEQVYFITDWCKGRRDSQGMQQTLCVYRACAPPSRCDYSAHGSMPARVQCWGFGSHREHLETYGAARPHIENQLALVIKAATSSLEQSLKNSRSMIFPAMCARSLCWFLPRHLTVLGVSRKVALLVPPMHLLRALGAGHPRAAC